MIVDPIALKVIMRDLLRVEEDYRSALPGAPVRTDKGRRSRRRRSRTVSDTPVVPPAQEGRRPPASDPERVGGGPDTDVRVGQDGLAVAESRDLSTGCRDAPQ